MDAERSRITLPHQTGPPRLQLDSKRKLRPELAEEVALPADAKIFWAGRGVGATAAAGSNRERLRAQSNLER